MTSFFSQHHPLASTFPSQDLSSVAPPDQTPFPPGLSSDGMPRTPSNQLANAPRPQNRSSGEYRSRNSFGANGNPAIPVPQAQSAQFTNGHPRNGGMAPAAQPFDIARSPPNPASKNTKHVPCKFFKQGACQAGQACPFLHSNDATVETAPCKYFTKGNCKFGAKCALAHILPDGRRVNRPNISIGMGMGVNGAHLNLGGRVNPPTFHNQDSALANSILTQQHYAIDPYTNQYPYVGQDDMSPVQDRNTQFQNIPSIEAGMNSNPGSKYGSPVDESRLPISPVGHYLTALDAPMPASFDSNGISHIARYGAVAASVPSKFGMESPPASLPRRSGNPNDAVKALRSAAFGPNTRSSSQLGSSPPNIPDESVGQRVMHSQKVSRPRMLSASVPRAATSDDWEEHFNLEEDLLPTNMHDDVLSPREKMRRLSRPEQDFSGLKDQSSALRIPSANSSKVGSPLASSPSRFSALFAKQREKKEQEGNPPQISAFGHVGSPLRESSIQQLSSPITQPLTNKWTFGEQSSGLSSPPRNPSTSILSQQMQGMKLNRADSGDGAGKLQPGSIRHASASAGRFDRTVSSPGIGSSRIDEEQGDLVFSMDEENSKRNSMIWGGKSPNFGPLHEGSNGTLRDGKESKSYNNGIENLFGVRP